jgi:hypothetical protein
MTELKLKDVDHPSKDFMTVGLNPDGSIHFMVIDTVNRGMPRFTSISKTDAVVLAHKLMEWAKA